MPSTMITLTLRPIHLALAVAFLAGVLLATGVLLLSADGSSSPDQAEAGANSQSLPGPIAADVAPSPEPTPPPEPTNPPQPDPPSPAAIRSCDEISQAGAYNSEEERQFFLANCLSNEAPAQPAPAPAGQTPASTSSSATAQEALYRDRAEGKLRIFAVKVDQYFNTPSLGAIADILEIGAVMRRQAQELDLLPAPPPRFQLAHAQFRASLVAFANVTAAVVAVDLEDEDETLAWSDDYNEAAQAMFAALDDYALVLGVELPPALAE